nr:carboxymuconolactone decarboxylase family protein [Mycoplana dimorpha]
MEQSRYERGLKMRRAVLGDDYVDRSIGQADAFNRDFQRIVTEYCWGETWADETLSPRERSILNLGMIAALGRMHEFELHTAGALRNGISHDELRAILTQIAVYCGIPAGVDCFRVARKVLNAEKDQPEKTPG